MGMAMGIGQILIIIGLLLSAISAGFLALAELKIKRESKVLVSKKWRPHPDHLRESMFQYRTRVRSPPPAAGFPVL